MSSSYCNCTRMTASASIIVILIFALLAIIVPVSERATVGPTPEPTPHPTPSPTLEPTLSPTLSPTLAPTLAPTPAPTPFLDDMLISFSDDGLTTQHLAVFDMVNTSMLCSSTETGELSSPATTGPLYVNDAQELLYMVTSNASGDYGYQAVDVRTCAVAHREEGQTAGAMVGDDTVYGFHYLTFDTLFVGNITPTAAATQGSVLPRTGATTDALGYDTGGNEVYVRSNQTILAMTTNASYDGYDLSQSTGNYTDSNWTTGGARSIIRHRLRLCALTSSAAGDYGLLSVWNVQQSAAVATYTLGNASAAKRFVVPTVVEDVWVVCGAQTPAGMQALNLSSGAVLSSLGQTTSTVTACTASLFSDFVWYAISGSDTIRRVRVTDLTTTLSEYTHPTDAVDVSFLSVHHVAGYTAAPSPAPTPEPTPGPTLFPTLSPTVSPTLSPTVSPTLSPTLQPTVFPTLSPTPAPTPLEGIEEFALAVYDADRVTRINITDGQVVQDLQLGNGTGESNDDVWVPSHSGVVMYRAVGSTLLRANLVDGSTETFDVPGAQSFTALEVSPDDTRLYGCANDTLFELDTGANLTTLRSLQLPGGSACGAIHHHGNEPALFVALQDAPYYVVRYNSDTLNLVRYLVDSGAASPGFQQLDSTNQSLAGRNNARVTVWDTTPLVSSATEATGVNQQLLLFTGDQTVLLDTTTFEVLVNRSATGGSANVMTVTEDMRFSITTSGTTFTVYDVTTGTLLNSTTSPLLGTIEGIAASGDGTKIFTRGYLSPGIGGQAFTRAIAQFAFDPSSNALTHVSTLNLTYGSDLVVQVSRLYCNSEGTVLWMHEAEDPLGKGLLEISVSGATMAEARLLHRGTNVSACDAEDISVDYNDDYVVMACICEMWAWPRGTGAAGDECRQPMCQTNTSYVAAPSVGQADDIEGRQPVIVAEDAHARLLCDTASSTGDVFVDWDLHTDTVVYAETSDSVDRATMFAMSRNQPTTFFTRRNSATELKQITRYDIPYGNAVQPANVTLATDDTYYAMVGPVNRTYRQALYQNPAYSLNTTNGAAPTGATLTGLARVYPDSVAGVHDNFLVCDTFQGVYVLNISGNEAEANITGSTPVPTPAPAPKRLVHTTHAFAPLGVTTLGTRCNCTAQLGVFDVSSLNYWVVTAECVHRLGFVDPDDSYECNCWDLVRTKCVAGRTTTFTDRQTGAALNLTQCDPYANGTTPIDPRSPCVHPLTQEPVTCQEPGLKFFTSVYKSVSDPSGKNDQISTLCETMTVRNPCIASSICDDPAPKRELAAPPPPRQWHMLDVVSTGTRCNCTATISTFDNTALNNYVITAECEREPGHVDRNENYNCNCWGLAIVNCTAGSTTSTTVSDTGASVNVTQCDPYANGTTPQTSDPDCLDAVTMEPAYCAADEGIKTYVSIDKTVSGPSGMGNQIQKECEIMTIRNDCAGTGTCAPTTSPTPAPTNAPTAGPTPAPVPGFTVGGVSACNTDQDADVGYATAIYAHSNSTQLLISQVSAPLTDPAHFNRALHNLSLPNGGRHATRVYTRPHASFTLTSPASANVSSGETLTFAFAESGSVSDWVGLFRPGACNGTFCDSDKLHLWRYVCNSRLGCTSVVRTGSVELVAQEVPGTPGFYEAALLANNGYRMLARHILITVTTALTNNATLNGSEVVEVFPGPGEPTASPTLSPTLAPTLAPTVSPTLSPTLSPTVSPTLSPTLAPTPAPTPVAAVSDGGFETPSITASTFSTESTPTPSPSPWAFTGNSGVMRASSAMDIDSIGVHADSQSAFIAGDGTISQTFALQPAGALYGAAFSYAGTQRASDQCGLKVYMGAGGTNLTLIHEILPGDSTLSDGAWHSVATTDQGYLSTVENATLKFERTAPADDWELLIDTNGSIQIGSPTTPTGTEGSGHYIKDCSLYDHWGSGFVIRVTMGECVDYFFASADTYTLCDVIGTFSKHEWSPDMYTTPVVPVTSGFFLGSTGGWVAGFVERDVRQTLPILGDDITTQTGAFGSTLYNQSAGNWGQAYTLHVKRHDYRDNGHTWHTVAKSDGTAGMTAFETGGTGAPADANYIANCSLYDSFGADWVLRLTMGTAVDYYFPRYPTTTLCEFYDNSVTNKLHAIDLTNVPRVTFVDGVHHPILDGTKSWRSFDYTDERDWAGMFGVPGQNGGCCCTGKTTCPGWGQSYTLALRYHKYRTNQPPWQLVSKTEGADNMDSTDYTNGLGSGADATQVRACSNFDPMGSNWLLRLQIEETAIDRYVAANSYNSACEVLTATAGSALHSVRVDVSRDTLTPTYYTVQANMGGSSNGWPAGNFPKDSRAHLGFWGTDHTPPHLGGCCGVAYNDTTTAWGDKMTMLIRPFPEHGGCAADHPVLLDEASVVLMGGTTQAPTPAPTPVSYPAAMDLQFTFDADDDAVMGGTINGANGGWMASDGNHTGLMHVNGSATYFKANSSNTYTGASNNLTIICIARAQANAANYDHLFQLWDVAGGQEVVTMGTGPSDNLILYFNNSGSAETCESAANSILDDQWIHYAITYDGTAATLYRNGVVLQRCPMTFTVTTTLLDDIYIFYHATITDTRRGYVDMAGISNAVWTQEQILQHHLDNGGVDTSA